MSPIYLDYNATAPLRPAVAATMAEALAHVGNASSVHQFGRQARRAVEDARDTIAALVGAVPAQVVFTGSGTEANNLAIRGSDRGRHLVSAIEHDSVRLATDRAAPIPVERNGVISVA